MEQSLTHIILNLIGLILIFKWFKHQYYDYKLLKGKSAFFRFKRFKSILLALFIIGVPLVVINYTDIEVINHISRNNLDKNHKLYALFTSLFISLLWLRYILKLDIFDKEKKRNILVLFVLSIFFTLLADIPYTFIHLLGFTESPNATAGFLYSVFGIGLIEETIKFIPLLIILQTTKAIDEPYDYILYASVSALGFAFVENTMYLDRFGLEIISGRALYATVAHMAFSSIIAYGLMLNKYKLSKSNPVLVFISFYFLAIFAHGFYDFWLINKSVTHLQGLSTFFLLVCIHLWFSFKNNSINVSTYYDDSIPLNNDHLKMYLTTGLLSIVMFSYVYIAFKTNSQEANTFLIESFFVYGYLIFYITATLSRYNLIQGVLQPITVRIKNIIPKKKKL